MKRFLMPALIWVMVFFILFHSVSNMERVLVEDYRISTGSQEMIIMLDFNDNTSHTVILQDSIAQKFYNEILEKYTGRKRWKVEH